MNSPKHETNHEKENPKKKLVFVCTGNSCRSQMAEGFARHYGDYIFEVHSAGTAPEGINPLAEKVMKEAGIDISSQTSDLLDSALLQEADVIITLCGDARDSCPVISGNTEKRHWPVADPAKAEGSPEEIMEIFRKTRDEIEQRVKALVEEFK